jgi:hypothetical protein
MIGYHRFKSVELQIQPNGGLLVYPYSLFGLSLLITPFAIRNLRSPTSVLPWPLTSDPCSSAFIRGQIQAFQFPIFILQFSICNALSAPRSPLNARPLPQTVLISDLLITHFDIRNWQFKSGSFHFAIRNSQLPWRPFALHPVSLSP